MRRAILVAMVSAFALASGSIASSDAPRKVQVQKVIKGAETGIQDPARTGLVRELRRARTLGETARVAELEAQLGAPRNATAQTQDDLPIGVNVVSRSDLPPEDRPEAGPLWVDGDILVYGGEIFDVAPALASDSQNHLFCAFETQAPTGTRIRVHRSDNHGQTWYWLSEFFMAAGFSVLSPSIAVGEGNDQDYLLLAFIDAQYDRLLVYRTPLDVLSWEVVAVEMNSLGICNPQIVTDAREYPTWYPYVVYNSKGIDAWMLRFCRSTDYGTTWNTPITLENYSGSPNTYSGYDAYPDVEYGSSILYVAFDDYVGSTTVRDVYVVSSGDFGVSWSAATAVATTAYDESSPRLGAVKAHDSARTVMMCYNKYYGGIDWDVWYAYTQDGGGTWTSDNCLACYSGRLEAFCDVATSFGQGKIHVAFHDDGTVRYTSSPYDSPTSWGSILDISDTGVASVTWPRPSIDVIAGALIEVEAAVVWTDERTADREIYFDGGTTDDSGVDAGERAAPDLPVIDCQPNPFSSSTVISFTLQERSPTRAGIYDVSGRRVRFLMDSASTPPGECSLHWDGHDDSGQAVGPGIYFLRVTTPGLSAQSKLVMLR